VNSVFIRSSVLQVVPLEYSSGVVIGPVHDRAHCRFSHTLHNLLCRPSKPRPTVESFAALALATYTADKAYERSLAEDAWTRELIVSVPISPDFGPAVPILVDGLRFLSGDYWRVETRTEEASIGARTYYEDDFVADAVCLFSGGTDSLTGAINLLEDGKSIILVSHFESGAPAGVQRTLAHRLMTRYGPKRVRRLSIQVCSAPSCELSTRTRSFLFIALGLMTASAFGDDIPVYIPENGFIGINVPLTGSRQGSYSTRTTHPAYMGRVREGLQITSIGHDIVNPFARCSKGQVLRSSKNPSCLKELLPLTLSCATAGGQRFQGHPPNQNCGYCYPCLVRRAALHTIDSDDPDSYLYDAIGSRDVLRADRRGKHLRCVLQAIARYRRSSRSLFLEILKSGSISSVDNPFELIDPIETGLEELVALVSDKGCSDVKRYASL